MNESVQQTYPYSVKIEEGSRGEAKITIHVYNEDIEEVRKKAVDLFVATKESLRNKGVRVLE